MFDWELATIGDPLADVGYLTVTWVAGGRPRGHLVRLAVRGHPREGFPTREELIAPLRGAVGPRGRARSTGTSALALWKAAVFMEGNLKRFLAGSTDDEFLGLFVEGVPMLAEKAKEIAESG